MGDIWGARGRWPTPSANAACRSCSSTSRAARPAARSSRVAALPRSEGWTDLVPELNRQPSDIVVTKRTWGAFASTDLEAQLKARDVTQVVIAGVATGTGVEVDRATGL